MQKVFFALNPPYIIIIIIGACVGLGDRVLNWLLNRISEDNSPTKWRRRQPTNYARNRKEKEWRWELTLRMSKLVDTIEIHRVKLRYLEMAKRISLATDG